MSTPDTIDGYTIRKDHGGWVLLDPDGAHLMIDRHGCVAPSYHAAVEERAQRIVADRKAEATFQARLAAEAHADSLPSLTDALIEMEDAWSARHQEQADIAAADTELRFQMAEADRWGD